MKKEYLAPQMTVARFEVSEYLTTSGYDNKCDGDNSCYYDHAGSNP